MAGGAPGWEATWDLMEETESEGATVKVKERGGLVDLKVRDTEAEEDEDEAGLGSGGAGISIGKIGTLFNELLGGCWY